MEYITRVNDGRVLLPFEVENGYVSAIRSRDRKRIVILNDAQHLNLKRLLSEPGGDYLESITKTANIANNCLHLGRAFDYTDNLVEVSQAANRISINFLSGYVDFADRRFDTLDKRVA